LGATVLGEREVGGVRCVALADTGWKLLPPAPGSSTLTNIHVGGEESPGEIVA
jgi:hypothetical protein